MTLFKAVLRCIEGHDLSWFSSTCLVSIFTGDECQWPSACESSSAVPRQANYRYITAGYIHMFLEIAWYLISSFLTVIAVQKTCRKLSQKTYLSRPKGLASQLQRCSIAFTVWLWGLYLCATIIWLLLGPLCAPIFGKIVVDSLAGKLQAILLVPEVATLSLPFLHKHVQVLLQIQSFSQPLWCPNMLCSQ